MKTRICWLIMKLCLLLSSLVIVQAGVTRRDTQCDGPLINGVQHSKEILKTDLDRPYLLTTDYSSNIVYFSYNIETSANNDDERFQSAKINLNTNEFSNIEGVPNGFAQAVDQTTHDLYIGGSEGIYKYKADSNKAEYYGANGTDIWTLYFKDVLYFSNFPSQFLYVMVNGTVTRFEDLEDTMVDNFVVDNNDYLFFSNSSGLYSQKKGTKNAVFLNGDMGDEVRTRGLTTNKNGDVYACAQNGIYVVNKEKHTLDKYVHIDDAFGVAFDDNNNIIYADARSLVRLKPCSNK